MADDQKIEDDRREYMERKRQFWRAYDRLSEEGLCDSAGGAEYSRVLDEWRSFGCPMNYLDQFITARANAIPERIRPPDDAEVDWSRLPDDDDVEAGDEAEADEDYPDDDDELGIEEAVFRRFHDLATGGTFWGTIGIGANYWDAFCHSAATVLCAALETARLMEASGERDGRHEAILPEHDMLMRIFASAFGENDAGAEMRKAMQLIEPLVSWPHDQLEGVDEARDAIIRQLEQLVVFPYGESVKGVPTLPGSEADEDDDGAETDEGE